MLRKKVFAVVMILAVVFCCSGCTKDSPPADEPVKTEAEYKAEAEEQIDEENMQAELDKLEESIEQDLASEQ
jgi:hypothetical protein